MFLQAPPHSASGDVLQEALQDCYQMAGSAPSGIGQPTSPLKFLGTHKRLQKLRVRGPKLESGSENKLIYLSEIRITKMTMYLKVTKRATVAHLS